MKGEARRFISGHNGAHRPAEPLENRYSVEDRGYDTPCWIWQRAATPKGYGTIWDPATQKLVRAPRYFYERFVGPIPEGAQIDHLCRQPPCVNPEHLEPVTQAVNQQRGANAKLTRDTADAIRNRGSAGESRAALAREFGVSWPVVNGIVKGHLWP